MSTALEINRENAIIEELATLNREFTHAARKAVETGVRIGELLTEVKASLPHGQFMSWVEQHCDFSQRAANMYINAFQVKSATIANLTGEETLTQLAAMANSAKREQLAIEMQERKVKREAAIAQVTKEWQERTAPTAVNPEPFVPTVDPELEALLESLKAFRQAHAAPPKVSSTTDNLLLQVLNAIAEDLISNSEARKMFGRTIATMYHPDSGKIRKDTDLMASWNAFLTTKE